VVGSWREVLQIDQTSTSGPELNVTRSVIRTQIVHSQGVRGQGVQVGVVEVGTGSGNLPFDNPFLGGVFQDLGAACPGEFSFHGTTVVGVIRSSNSTVRGVAPESTLGFFPTCNGEDAFAQNRATAAANWGARVINLSWGDLIDSQLVLSANDRFFDSMVLNRARTVVKSAGNHGESEDGRVTSPGLAYNVITVGNFDDHNTTGLGDDTIADDSSYGDPISIQSDREKPEVAAPGTNIRSTTTESPWLNNLDFVNSGTSFAAPHVSGVAALIMNVSAAFEVRPEAVKSVIMASAVHNVIADPRLSEHDGAGGINAEMAVRIAREQGGSGWEGLSYNCSAPDVTSLPLNLTANKQTRVVIAWGTDPNYADYQDQPNADLDLQITAPDGSVVDASASFDNNYEIVDFRPGVSALHSLNILKFRCDLSPRRLGVAWLIR
jgi:subtilisin family serine protease